MCILHDKISLIYEPIWINFPSVIHTVIEPTAARWKPRCYSILSLQHNFTWILLQVTAEAFTVKKLYMAGWIHRLELVSDGGKEEQIFAWIWHTLPGKREVSTPWVSRAERLTVLVRDGRHLLKVLSCNVNLRKQASFALYPKQRGQDDGNKADAATCTVHFSDAVTTPWVNLGWGIWILLENPDTTFARAAMTGGLGIVQLYLRWHLNLWEEIISLKVSSPCLAITSESLQSALAALPLIINRGRLEMICCPLQVHTSQTANELKYGL